MSILLTTRDRDILDALTKRVRVLSFDQIARTWWANSENAPRVAENRLRSLAKAGLVEIMRSPAHPELRLENPIVTWRPGEPVPNLGAASYRMKARWRDYLISTPSVSASKIAFDRFGGYSGHPPRAVERTHDLHMSQVFLIYRLRDPMLNQSWIFEEQIKTERRLQRSAPLFAEKLPDAILRTEFGIERVIEFGGAYDKQKLNAFHGYCEERSLPYEVW